MKRIISKPVTGVLLGLVIGALGVYTWVQHMRFRGLETEEWVPEPANQYTGSESCRECHERFYKLWSPSHHGKAMQPATRQLFAEKMQPLAEPLAVGDTPWSVDGEALKMVEHATAGERDYSIVHAMGGKNVYFFLPPLKRGRLQVLPQSWVERGQTDKLENSSR